MHLDKQARSFSQNENNGPARSFLSSSKDIFMKVIKTVDL